MNGAVPVSPTRLNGMDKDNSTITFTRHSIYCQFNFISVGYKARYENYFLTLMVCLQFV
jgi:hypothetical protein